MLVLTLSRTDKFCFFVYSKKALKFNKSVAGKELVFTLGDKQFCWSSVEREIKAWSVNFELFSSPGGTYKKAHSAAMKAAELEIKKPGHKFKNL